MGIEANLVKTQPCKNKAINKIKPLLIFIFIALIKSQILLHKNPNPSLQQQQRSRENVAVMKILGQLEKFCVIECKI
jgi:hypothetical protein